MSKTSRLKALTVVIATAAALAVSIEIDLQPPPPSDDVAYLQALLNPVDIGRQLCSSSTSDGYAARRPPFLRFARAQAANLNESGTPQGPPPLWTGLGDLQMAITTGSEEARQFFNQGMRIANDFNHLEAVRSFRHAQRLNDYHFTGLSGSR